MTERTLIELRTPMGEQVSIAYHDLGPQDRAPRVALVGGLCGDALNAVFVLARLADFLGRCGDDGPRRLAERVVIVPAVNALGFNTGNRAWPAGAVDLNRIVPGNPSGEPSQRLVAALLELTRPAYYRVDVHSSNAAIEELPQVRVYAPNDDERATACLFGLPAVIERPVNPLYTSTLVHAWGGFGGENFILQAGRAGALQAPHCERLFGALVAFLEAVGVITGVQLSGSEHEDLQYFGLEQSYAVLAQSAGFFVSRLEVGRRLRKGDRIGEIYDGFSGQLRAEVCAPVAGLLSGLRRQPLLLQGDLIARLQTTGPDGNEVERTLHDLGQ